jgi:hypothetical protein
MPLKKSFSTFSALTGAVLLLAGCAAVGPTDDPFLRSLTWQRYVGGDDIARACQPGQPERWRLVYNAVEDEQRRTYDLTALAEGGAMLEVQAIGRPNLNDPKNPISLRDPLAPWRGQRAMYRLDAAEYARLKQAIAAAGFEATAPEGLFLRGDSFYWTASACRNGGFHFHAWSWPSAEFDRMAVPLLEALQPFDKTGVEARQPYPVALPPYSSYLNAPDTGSGRQIPHRFQVQGNGLRYTQGTIN